MNNSGELSHRECSNCGIVGELGKDFTRSLRKISKRPANKIGDWHSRCKPCRSEINARIRLEKLIELKPHLYIECSNCDHIFNKCHDKCRRCGKYRFGRQGRDRTSG